MSTAVEPSFCYGLSSIKSRWMSLQLLMHGKTYYRRKNNNLILESPLSIPIQWYLDNSNVDNSKFRVIRFTLLVPANVHLNNVKKISIIRSQFRIIRSKDLRIFRIKEILFRIMKNYSNNMYNVYTH